MRPFLFICTFPLFFLLLACKGIEPPIRINVLTVSGKDNIRAEYTIENTFKDARLFTVSLTNTGDETECIDSIFIRLTSTPVFNENSRFLYCGYDMGKSPIQQCGYNEPQIFTESVLLVRRDESRFFKVGLLTWEIFRAAISFSKEGGILISAEGEGKPIKPGETLHFEKFIVEEGNDWQDLLFEYGRQIAKIQNIEPKEIGKWKGWGTWDYFGHDFAMEDIKSNMDQIKTIDTSANIIQLDASWWVNRGDYLETRPHLTGGMKEVARLINENGFTAGLHLDGFRGVSTSNVYKEHPDWFLKDQDGNTIFGPYSRKGVEEKRVFFDYSNPAACDYIRNVLKTMVNDWGYKYIKVDFLLYGLNRNIFSAVKDTSVKKIGAFDTAMTSMERTRAGLKAMREGIGEAYFLGCSSVFGPGHGLIDGLRTGPDINPRYDAYQTHVLYNAGSFFLNESVVQTDADYIVVRSKEDEDSTRAQGKNKFGGNVSLNEAAMWADYITLFGGVKLSSDDLNLLRPERKELVKKVFSINTCTRFIPVDLWDKAKNKEDAFNIILGTNDQGVYLALFNWNSTDLTIKLSDFPAENIELVHWVEKPDYEVGTNSMSIQMEPHTSVIFELTGNADFDEIRKAIKYEFVN